MPYILTCPASRGIGFALTRRLLQTTDLPVVATARTDPDRTRDALLDGLDHVDERRLDVLPVDVTDEASIAAAARHCSSKFPDTHLHLAFTLPGVLHPEKAPGQIDAAAVRATLDTNLLGPLLLVKHLAPLLPRKATPLPASSPPRGLPRHASYVLMSARVGSIADNALGGWYSYRASKAGVAALAKTLDLHLRAAAGPNALALAMHPGTVRTDLSKPFWQGVPPGKLFEPEQAADSLLHVLRRLKVEQRGRCWDWKGEEIPP